ncbi:hypothetical protein KKG83_06410 [Candidatus Micrarchaeota archaeon]|nr:hypothetical protein [Candidatus Micrarchaeota archaeon]MBU2477075.1 hypothetical protein [Candidatus Micrarchaeota archaeon]
MKRKLSQKVMMQAQKGIHPTIKYSSAKGYFEVRSREGLIPGKIIAEYRLWNKKGERVSVQQVVEQAGYERKTERRFKGEKGRTRVTTKQSGFPEVPEIKFQKVLSQHTMNRALRGTDPTIKKTKNSSYYEVRRFKFESGQEVRYHTNWNTEGRINSIKVYIKGAARQRETIKIIRKFDEHGNEINSKLISSMKK